MFVAIHSEKKIVEICMTSEEAKELLAALNDTIDGFYPKGGGPGIVDQLIDLLEMPEHA